MSQSASTKEIILLIAGFIGLISYVAFPELRDPLLLPIYTAMVGLPFAINKDKKQQHDEESHPPTDDDLPLPDTDIH